MTSTTAATKSSGSSVFDRLYSKSTESSRVRKSVAPVTDKNILTRQDDTRHQAVTPHSSIPKKRSHPTKNTVRTRIVAPVSSKCGPGIHDRLYSKGTASYNSKRKAATTGVESSTGTSTRGPLKTKTNA
ncbi:hypothetical protein IV203_000933 [Nitzschia inconspicua]|uniref:Uncharacterized protein n=1 Tax=Nitzschia inconspicua TaxID=303405 RepID=A0A9K3PQQ3_9STRA|nr:hypothetical protein IV203_000933 [Nitzschia inconspicua]